MNQVLLNPVLDATQATETKIITLLVRMGHEVEIAVDHAIESLLNSDEQLVAGILHREAAINEMEMEIDKAVFTALEDGSLSEMEIRSVASILKINKDLERLGDLATNIARSVTAHRALDVASASSELQPLAIAVHHLCRQTLRALARQDFTLASNALLAGASVDAYRNYVFHRLCERRDGPAASNAVTLLFASRYLEQIADHATDLAENLVRFLQNNAKRGQNPRDGQLAS
jgi:phosphate transport system protein